MKVVKIVSVLCELDCIEDQLHFMFHCPLYNIHRNELYENARNAINYWDNLPECEKLSALFRELPRKLAE